jgi:hypothetical protein
MTQVIGIAKESDAGERPVGLPWASSGRGGSGRPSEFLAGRSSSKRTQTPPAATRFTQRAAGRAHRRFLVSRPSPETQRRDRNIETLV